MSELLDNAFKALFAYPPIAALAGLIVIVGGGVWLIMRGERDRKSGGNGGQLLPAWTLYGPAHDAMQSLHNISESCRASVKSLEAIEKEQRQQTQLLEFIRNNQEMRGDPQPPPNPRNLKRGI